MQRDKRLQLTWACEEQLFRQEMENADDVRLSVRLFSRCMPDKRKVCYWVCVRKLHSHGGYVARRKNNKNNRYSFSGFPASLLPSVLLVASNLSHTSHTPVSQFCKEIEPGNARTKECLEENREELSLGC